MLIALLVSLYFGGGPTEILAYIADTQDSVKIVMTNDDRQKEALNTLKAMKKRANAYDKQARRTAKGLHKAFRNHDTTAVEVDAIWVEHFTGIDQYNHEMLDLRFELREHINREEWQHIFSRD